jgi:uncharacterized protein (TIGR00255 family)
MIRSMTGFGAGRARQGDEELAVEVRSVNAKFCEVKPRLPRELSALEVELTRQVKARLQRGSVEVFVKRLAGTSGSALQPRVDLALARDYAALHAQLSRELGLSPEPPTTAELMAAEGVLVLEERPADLDHAREALTLATATALTELETMRAREGAALAGDLLGRARRMRELAALIAAEAPRVVLAYRDKLLARIAELSQGQGVDPGRIAQEAALFADRSDVAEELTRLASHLDQFEKLVGADEPAGRRMEFLVQEMGREVNTTGSKSQSAALAATVVELKAELERIREQVANVE